MQGRSPKPKKLWKKWKTDQRDNLSPSYPIRSLYWTLTFCNNHPSHHPDSRETQTTEWQRPTWGISVAPLADITAEEQWAIATCYTCSYYCYCGCYCLYRDHHRGWAAILSGDQLTAGVQAGQSSCSLWWSGCNATTPATSQMFLDFYRVYGCFSLKR